MKKFQVHLSLKNGNKHTFIEWALGDREIINRITNSALGRWYVFTENYVRYQVLKEEIVSIGITLTNEQMNDYNKQQNDYLQQYGDSESY
ncbi:hypothetical protein WKH57_27935 [Niallia taxi]|uniref:hypothetical protein n=1 Tax=Niallia TaxID=2837506 RepID=UPI001EDA4DB9|nr:MULTISPECIES: hypothetical protein [Niallia]UPO91039.1 hypothetical protein L8T27_027285 [Niallia sp. Man26]WOD61340.1 hypothetical protein NQZ71_10920 [Niallia taxi]